MKITFKDNMDNTSSIKKSPKKKTSIKGRTRKKNKLSFKNKYA